MVEPLLHMGQFDKNITEFIDYQYFGNNEFYSTLIRNKNINFSPELPYQKAHHPNRMWLYGANGLMSLSIPLLGGRNQKGIFKDVQIAEDRNWRRIHWRSIHDAYRKSPWFEELGWQVEAIYKRPEKFLLDWNLKTMQLAVKLLGFKMDILTQSDFIPDQQQALSISSNPVIKPAEGFKVYQQVFMERHGFIGNLSILDLLFCCGATSKDYLS